MRPNRRGTRSHPHGARSDQFICPRNDPRAGLIVADLPVPPEPVPPGRPPVGRTTLRRVPWRSSRRRSAATREVEIPSPSAGYASYGPPPLIERTAWSRPWIPRPDLLQVQGLRPAGSQTQHAIASVLQQGGGRHASGHRDRRGPVGLGAVHRGRAVRPGGQGLHGARVVRPEAVPAHPHGDLRCPGGGQPVTRHRLRSAGARGDPWQPRLAGYRHQRGGRGYRGARRHPVRPGLGAQPRAAAPDRHRHRGARADGAGGRQARRGHRLRGWRLQLRGPHLPVRGPEAARRERLPDHRGRARGGAQPYAGHLSL